MANFTHVDLKVAHKVWSKTSSKVHDVQMVVKHWNKHLKDLKRRENLKLNLEVWKEAKLKETNEALEKLKLMNSEQDEEAPKRQIKSFHTTEEVRNKILAWREHKKQESSFIREQNKIQEELLKLKWQDHVQKVKERARKYRHEAKAKQKIRDFTGNNVYDINDKGLRKALLSEFHNRDMKIAKSKFEKISAKKQTSKQMRPHLNSSEYFYLHDPERLFMPTKSHQERIKVASVRTHSKPGLIETAPKLATPQWRSQINFGL